MFCPNIDFMSTKLFFINNDFVPEDEARLPVADLSVQRGYGVFDYLRVANGTPLFLNLHLDRLYRSAAYLHLQLKFTPEELSNIIQTLIQKNNIAQSGIRITVTGGSSPDGYSLAEPAIIVTQSAVELPGPEAFEQGIKLVTYPHARQLPEVKTIDYLMAIWLQPLIKGKGADDVLYYQKGSVTECPRANFFIVTKQGTVLTQGKGVLRGITRMRLLQGKDVLIQEHDVSLNDVYDAAEAFITSTTKSIMPVVQIDERIIGNGRPGAVTRQLHRQLTDSH